MKVKIGFIFLMAFLVRIELATAQTSTSNPKVESKLMLFFQRYKYKSQDPHKTKLTGCEVNDSARTITAVVDEYFSTQEFTPTIVNQIYTKLKGVLPKPYNRYKMKVVTNGMAIEDLVPNRLTKYADRGRMWGDIGSMGATSPCGRAMDDTLTSREANGAGSAPSYSVLQKICSHR